VGSLCPTFVPAWLVGLTVKPPYTNTLHRRFPSALRGPLGASVTFWEATAPVKLPTRQCPPTKSGLGPRKEKGGISRTAPPRLAPGLLSLPPILHITAPRPMPRYSKASRGLFVLPRVVSIFTDTAISPGPPPRQWPDRYAFHAGRNLPDKGLRYLRTVRVTAAVHRGFSSDLLPPTSRGISTLPLTFRHWAGISPYT